MKTTHYIGMKHAMALLALVMLFAVLFTSCSESEPPTPPAPRTVLVYMVATNNLGITASGYETSFDRLDLDEMRRAVQSGALSGGSRLLVYRATTTDAPTLSEFKADGTLEVIETYPKTSHIPVESNTMEEVIRKAQTYAPANTYGLVLWSHASGWLVDGMEDTPDTDRPMLMSFGQDYGRKMNVSTLASVLRGKGFDWVYFDCCFMASVEVAYSLRDVCDYIVASATELPGEGMPYDLNIPLLLEPTTKHLVEAAQNTYDNYNRRTDYNRSCAISVLRTKGMSTLARTTLDIYSKTNYTSLADDYIPQTFDKYTRYYYDFGDYVHALAEYRGIDTGEFDLAMNNVVMYRAATPMMWPGDADQFEIKKHSGLSTFILQREGDELVKGYYKTSWYNDVASRLLQDM